jgi:hypothetical protein
MQPLASRPTVGRALAAGLLALVLGKTKTEDVPTAVADILRRHRPRVTHQVWAFYKRPRSKGWA